MNKDNKQNAIKRPPVVVIMGHIDHGKSTLLDYIRKTKVVEGEAGGITQHVGAYEASFTAKDGKTHSITFLDTPGHAAFCNIRERGAQAADIAVLIVSAEDGVKPQTIEAYKDIKEAKVPFLVAITKIDKPNANIEKAKTSLGENEIYVEGWGGDIPCLPISSVTGEGVTELLDMIILMAEMADLKTNDSDQASGIIVDTTLDSKKGLRATLLIKNGTLEKGSFVVSGNAYAPVRFIENFQSKQIEKGLASQPVSVLGWNEMPACGTPFISVPNKKEAEKITEEYRENNKKVVTNQRAKTSDTDLIGKVVLPLIIKADVIGSLEGVMNEIQKIRNEKVMIKVIGQGVGDINENDIKMALSDPETIILGFNADPDKKTKAMIERSMPPIHCKTFNIIYELSEYLESEVLKRVPKQYKEETTGTVKILAIFSKEKDKQVIGGKVETGTISTGAEIKIMRRGTEIGRGKIRELQSKKVRVTEVAEGFEFGMAVEAKMEIAVGDRVEAVRTVELVTG